MEVKLDFVETIEGKEWVAEFTATGNFNLHLERDNNGSLIVKQRGTENGEYATAFSRGMYEGKRVFDYDFGALVYPKWIRIESGSKVVSGTITLSEG